MKVWLGLATATHPKARPRHLLPGSDVGWVHTRMGSGTFCLVEREASRPRQQVPGTGL